MTDPTPATVAVPVELLVEWRDKFQHMGYMPTANTVEKLLPKPTLRLVAVTRDQWHGDSMTDGEFDSQPDLLALLDEAVRPVLDAGRLALVMDRIRAALGVAE